MQAPIRSSPRFSAGGPDADEYGAQLGYPVAAIHRPRFLVGMFSHYDRLWEVRQVRRAASTSPLKRAVTEPALTYPYDGRPRTLDDYLARNPSTGLLIARSDTILVERYQYGRSDAHRLASFSIAKTFVSMLIGIAIEEGAIRSIDDLAAVYAPSLAGAEYGRTSLRHLLQMSSGVRFEADREVDRLRFATVGQGSAGGADAVKPFNDRHRIGGAIFNYSSAESLVLGLVLSGAVKRPLAVYLQERIWQPMGAEADASWMVDAAGQETGLGYGFHTWVFNDKRPMFALRGAFGQAIFVDPASRLVTVQTAVHKQASDPIKEALALWRGVVATLGVPWP